MWPELLFISALVVTGGVVAWVGDIVGYRLGKKRVSLFGIRPRTTALMIGVLSGSLISIVTIGVLTLASKYVRRALFQQAQIQEDLAQLQNERADLQREVERSKAEAERFQERESDARKKAAEAEARVNDTREKLTNLQGRLATQQQRLQELLKRYRSTNLAKQGLERERKGLQREIAALQNEIATLQYEIAGVHADLNDAEGDLQQARTDLQTTQEQLKIEQGRVALRGEQLLAQWEKTAIFRAGEELTRRAIDTAQPTSAVQGALYDLLDAASGVAVEKGAAIGDNGRAVRYSVDIPGAKAPSLWEEMPEYRAVTGAAQELVQRSEKSMAVGVISRYNALPDEQARVIFQYTPNKLVFTEGEVVGRIRAEGQYERKRIYAELMILLTQIAHKAAADRGMLPQPNSNEYGSMSMDEVFDAIEEIKQRGHDVEVEAVVQQDTWTVGPLNLDLRIEPPSTSNAKL